MMRLARRATLLIAFYILTSAATASAECAWVLWEENPPQSNSVLQFNFDAKREGRKEMPVPNYVCLPDTVDPRGPKGR